MRRFVATMGLLAAATAVPAARAQDALGNGGALQRDTRHAVPNRATRDNPLDANTRVGSFGANDTAAKQDFYSRNLIVTGDVGGGRQFRGNVGYREQSEFTGQVGSDDNRFWAAYSVYSSPYMFQAGYNPLRASQEFGAIMYTRTYANASARDILTNQQPLDARIAFDRFTADGSKMKRQADIIDPGNVRDTAARVDWRRIREGSDRDRDTRWRGIPVDDLVGSLGLSAYDRQRLKADILAGRTQREWIGDPFQDTSILPGASLVDSARIRATLAPEYGAILDTLRARAGDRIPASTKPEEPAVREKAATDRLNTDLEWLRGELMRSGVEGGTRRGAGEGTQGPRQPSVDQPRGTGPLGPDGKPQLGPDGKPVEPAKPTDSTSSGGPDAAKQPAPNLDELAYILRHGKKLQSLVPEDSSAIRDMMELGADGMRRGEFFRAEERFNTVLQVVPNSALALAGVANSQLGAGLYVSSALSLRKLFAMHPEMIGTRLGSEVIPSDDRLAAALAAARERLAGANLPTASSATKSDRFEFGLLIAYVGFQTDKPDAVAEGLAAMRAAKPGDALPELLQRVWVPGAAPAAPPAAEVPAPAAEPTRPTSPSVR